MNHILIIQTASLGDVILATSVAETLHKQFPDSSIDFLIKDGYESLFFNHPFIKKVLLWNKKEKKYLGLIKLIFEVRKSKYNAVINIQRHFSSGLITAFSGAEIRSGFKKNPLSFLFTNTSEHHIVGENSEHEIVRNYRLIDFLVKTPVSKPKLYPSDTDESFIKPLKKGRYITLSPASLWYTKQFPIHKWIEFIDQLSGDIFVYLLGATTDKLLCEHIIKLSKNLKIENLAGKLSTLQSAALMKEAVMNYVNDSAPLHFASATNAPLTAVFCSTLPSFGFGPLSDNSAIIETEKKLKCKPCGLHGHQSCPEKHFLCAESISARQLLNRLTNG